jgi:hypothetical protein
VESRSLAIGWETDDPPGIEFAAVELGSDRLRASGVAVRSGPLLYRLDYELETATRFVTARLAIVVQGETWSRRLELRRSPSGSWTSDTSARGAPELGEPGGDLSSLEGALDCDLALSPLTNVMPVLRCDLLAGHRPAALVMAWVSVPHLSVHPSRQRYTPLPPAGDASAPMIRFEDDEGFRADLTLDDHGFVIDYPGIAHRLGRP